MTVSRGLTYCEQFIPEMIRLHRLGHFPLEKLCTFYPIHDFEKAISDVREGKVCRAMLQTPLTARLRTSTDYKTRSPVGLVREGLREAVGTHT